MWIPLFAVFVGWAVALAVGALILEHHQQEAP